ncbi:MAG: glycosyltransferase family 4 protein [Thermoplasmata archaeon]|nr:MAG: glycosyltransferase family 4 protein [Thermoplasmata archaeon]
MNNTDNMIFIGPINPFDSKISGTQNYVMNFLNSVNKTERVMLCGYTTIENVNKNIRSNIRFLPLVVYEKKKDRFLFPQTFKFILALYKRKKDTFLAQNVLHIQRLDFAIPFLFPSKKGKIVLYFHGAASKGYLTGKGLKSKIKGYIYLILEHLILPNVDKIVTVSKKDEEFYANKYPKEKEKIITIPIPINVDEFDIKAGKKDLRNRLGLNQDHKIILYVGRFSKVKGIDLIIRAFLDLNKEVPDVDLVLVGQGEEEGRLRELISSLRVKNVHFLRTLPHEDVPNILNCADVLAMASYTEGLPTILLEALACGLPVVSTDVGDIGNVVTSERIGFLLKNRSKEDYKNKLTSALKMSDEYKADRREVAERYSSNAMVKRIMKMHNELAGVI